MTISNKGIITIVISSIVIYLLALIPNKLILILILNLASSFSILLYWIIKQLRIKKHYYESREIIVLSFEILIFLVSSFSVFTHILPGWLKFIEYVFYGSHLIALIAFLFFALTFKMKRLF